MEYTSYCCVRGICGDGKDDIEDRVYKEGGVEMAFFTLSTALSISWLTVNSFLEADRESVKGWTMWVRRGRNQC